jgi:hypothetical protein
MAGMLRTMKLLVVAVTLAAGGLAFWRWRETAKPTWISIGGLEGFIDSAGYFVETVRPANSLVAPAAHVN